VRLVVSEAVSNVILHAYPEGEGAVHVSVAVVDDEVSVLVVDDGCGYRTPARTPGLGCGLDLMAGAANDLVLAE
jgi:serine/threonine-protein kinase RsbW